jgi:UDP-4-amino-4-deoxy-L-arabinose-oxoglutarate aminotransferase
LGVPDSVAVSSGTAALTVALSALPLKKGAEIVIPSYVCKSVAEAVISAQYKPVLCDVGDDWSMTAETVASALTNRTGAIIVVHIFGIPIKLDGFEKFDLPIVEDACQAFGATSAGQMVGTIGTIGIFSFHATKCLTTGEGGLAVAKDQQLLERMRSLRDGEKHPIARVVAPMTDLQAALGLSQISRYPSFLKRRKTIAERYFHGLRDCPIRLPYPVRKDSIFFRFPVRVSGDFYRIRQRFAESGIHVRQGVDELLHNLIKQPGNTFANAENLLSETVSIPIYPALTDDEQEAVLHACRNIFEKI